MDELPKWIEEHFVSTFDTKAQAVEYLDRQSDPNVEKFLDKYGSYIDWDARS